MRIRRRSSAPVDASTDWVGPYWLERQRDPDSPSFVAPAPDAPPVNVTARTWTPVGTIGSPPEAVVDQRGLVTPWRGGWSLDWWIGADDRWHLPSREVAVRQRLVDDVPIVETAMRVPTGDAVQRVYAIHHDGGELLVVEIENRSTLPFAVALAVRPMNAEGLSTIARIEMPDDTTVIVDGRVAMLLPKRPSRVATSIGTDGDVAAVVLSGGAGETFTARRDPDGRASATFIYPLPHTATLRVCVPVTSKARSMPASLPSVTQVAKGWGAHAAQGVRFELPDARLASIVAANRAFLLLRDARDGAAVLGALDRYGHEREVADALRADPIVAAVAEHWRLHRDRDLAIEVAPLVAHVAEQIARRRTDPAGRRVLLDAAEVLAAAGEITGAQDATRLAAEHPVADPPDAAETLTSMLSRASATWTWPDADRDVAAAVLSTVRDQLVRETDDGLALCTTVPDTWLGQGIEVYDAPTHAGYLSYAVRWHGDRPALLWDLVKHDGVGDVRITVPGLDPAWSSTDTKGDALLAPVAPPGNVSAVSLRRGAR